MNEVKTFVKTDIRTVQVNKSSRLGLCVYRTSLALYRKIPILKPWAYICSKGFSAGLIFGGELIFHVI